MSGVLVERRHTAKSRLAPPARERTTRRRAAGTTGADKLGWRAGRLADGSAALSFGGGSGNGRGVEAFVFHRTAGGDRAAHAGGGTGGIDLQTRGERWPEHQFTAARIRRPLSPAIHRPPLDAPAGRGAGRLFVEHWHLFWLDLRGERETQRRAKGDRRPGCLLHQRAATQRTSKGAARPA